MKLDDQNQFIQVLDLCVPWAHTWADMRPGKTDLERRENFRKAALMVFQPTKTEVIDWWAFRIFVTKTGRQLDLDNITKPIVDSFCSRQIERDNSIHVELGLYPDDGLNHVRHIVLSGKPCTEDSTRIEIFGHLRGK
ncbi:hypothetical protein [Parahaliea mediterranea]|uniref:hypothetical protein n=1 Tax=Parahaliea mediterranea TaxID=651086 RepID=UPI000E2E890E|nr:hypothetical protein [Parahaliea mediterranea]